MSKSCKLGLLKTNSVERKDYPEFVCKTVADVVKELVKNNFDKKLEIRSACKLNGVFFSVVLLETYGWCLKEGYHKKELEALGTVRVYGVSERDNCVLIAAGISDSADTVKWY